MYFSQTVLPSLYSTTKQRETDELKQVKFFSATTDIWSSVGLTPYMSYTLHCIAVIGLSRIDAFFPRQHHTGENNFEADEKCLRCLELI